MSPQTERINVFVLLVVVALASSILGAPDDQGQTKNVDFKTAFERTAPMEGKAYIVSRSYLLDHADEVIPIAREMVDSKTWQQRDLARALILRVEHPELVTKWELAVGNWRQKIVLLNDETVQAQFPDYAKPVTDGRIAGKTLDVDRRSVPFLLEKLREVAPDGLHPTGTSGHILTILKHFREPTSADALLVHFFHPRQPFPMLEDLIVAMGTAVAERLRETVKKTPARFGRPNPQVHYARYYQMLSAIRAARVLGRMRDRESVPLLLEKQNAAPVGQFGSSCATALARIGAEEALSVAFEDLLDATALAAGEREESSSSLTATYAEYRSCVLAFGEPAHALLERMSKADQPTFVRAVAAGLLFEQEHPDEVKAYLVRLGTMHRQLSQMNGERWLASQEPLQLGRQIRWTRQPPRFAAVDFVEAALPIALLREQVVALGDHRDIERLVLEKDRLSVETVGAAALKTRSDHEALPRMLLALAAVKHERSLAVCEQLIKRRDSAQFAGGLVEAMLMLGSEEAVPLLEGIVLRAGKGDQKMQDAATVAEIVIPVLRDRGRGLEKLLDHESASIRLIAAKRLARDGDLRSLPVLTATAVASVGNRHSEIRNLIVGLGEPAVAPLKAKQEASKDNRENLFCEAAVVAIKQPELVKKIKLAAAIRGIGFMGRAGPSVHDFRAAGQRVAEFVGEEAVPLLEASLEFETDKMNRGIGAFALAKFKQPRSIPIVVQAMRNPIYAQGGNLAAEALAEFGNEGVAAAKNILPPDPDKVGFTGRAMRHRGATRVLVNAEEKQSVENILKVLEKVYDIGEQAGPETYSTWRRRVVRFLGLAAEVDDKRLIEPLSKFARHADGGFAEPSLLALRKYDDRRVADVALDAIRQKNKDAQEVALRILVKHHGAKAPKMVVELLNDAESAAEALLLIQAIDILGRDTGCWVGEKGVDPESPARLAEARITLKAALLERSTATDESQQTAAVEAIANYDAKDAEVAMRLTAWLKDHPNASQQVVNYVIASKREDGPTAILTAYRATHRYNLAQALGNLRFKPALKDLCEGLDQQIKTRRDVGSVAEIQALAQLGNEGLAKLHELLRSDASLHHRAAAAEALGQQDFEPAFGDIRELLRGLAERGLDHPGVPDPKKTSFHPRVYLDRLVFQLATSLASLDRVQAKSVLIEAILLTDEPTIQRELAEQSLKLVE